MLNLSKADEVLGVNEHPLKRELRARGVTQQHVALILGRGPMYAYTRLKGFRPFAQGEEAKLREALAAVGREGGEV